eukprot:3814563-Pyramimonas_sp.AAC.1
MQRLEANTRRRLSAVLGLWVFPPDPRTVNKTAREGESAPGNGSRLPDVHCAKIYSGTCPT